jgi:hypothetical protein
LRISDTGRATSSSSSALFGQTSGTSLLVFSLIAAFVLGFLAHQYRWVELPLQWGAALISWRARTVLPSVNLEVRFDDYKRLSGLRDRALQLGVHVPFEEESIAAVLVRDAGSRESVMVRLPGGPVLPGEAWPLDVRHADAVTWLRLTPLGAAQAPSAWQQWGYLEALRREGFTAATLAPVSLEVNGTAWGMYIVETLPPVTAVACFNAQGVWEALAAGGPVTEGGFRYADATGDPAAAALLRAVLAGKVALSEVGDAERLGRFLALTALWTGQPAPDWRALHWRYDSATHTLAPVGTGQPWADPAPLPEAFFVDPAVQVAYARALTEFSRPAYLEHIRRDYGPALEAQWQVMGEASAVPWATLEVHQRAMRARLAPAHALAATLEPEATGFVLWMANRQSFPVEVVGLDAGGAGVYSLDPAWVRVEDHARLAEAGDALVLRGATGALPQPVRIALPRNLTAAGGDVLVIVARLWGVDGQELRIPVLEREAAP